MWLHTISVTVYEREQWFKDGISGRVFYTCIAWFWHIAPVNHHKSFVSVHIPSSLWLRLLLSVPFFRFHKQDLSSSITKVELKWWQPSTRDVAMHSIVSNPLQIKLFRQKFICNSWCQQKSGFLFLNDGRFQSRCLIWRFHRFLIFEVYKQISKLIDYNDLKLSHTS